MRRTRVDRVLSVARAGAPQHRPAPSAKGRSFACRSWGLRGAPLFVALLLSGLIPRPGHCEDPLREEPLRVDFLMDRDPVLTMKIAPLQFSEALIPLWRKALRHEETDLKRQAAAAIVDAHRQGMKGLAVLIPDLVQPLEAKPLHPVVRFGAARALVALDARNQAALLRSLLTDDVDLARVIEPALAEWDDRPARDLWLKRLDDPRPSRQLLILAMRCLGRVREPRSADGLERLATDVSQPADLRLEAAAGLGRVRPQGLESLAKRLIDRPGRTGLIDRLVGLRLLEEHTGEATVTLLQSAARDAEPAAATAALKRLFQLSPDHLLPHAEWCVAHSDAEIRRVMIETLTVRPDDERIRLLATLLDDPHPANRGAVRESLRHLSDKHRAAVIDGAMTMLGTEQWRGLEQAALLLGWLDHEPAADRLLQLMDFPRREVFISAAWALRELAVEQTLAPLLKLAEDDAAGRRKTESPHGRDEWGALVFETFGAMKYQPAETLMRTFVPKNMMLGERTRAGAIWALGHLHAGKAPDDLPPALLERANDIASLPPELERIRIQSTIAIGRMQAKSLAPDVKKVFESQEMLAAAWAYEQLTGESLRIPEPPPRFAGPWFLEPLPRPAANSRP